MDRVSLARTLATGASYYGSVGGIIEDGSITRAQLNQTMVDAYNNAISSVQSSTYYNTEMMLVEHHDIAMDNLSLAVDDLVAATAVFATVEAVAEMAAEASAGNAQDQLEAQQILNTTDMTVSEQDVDNFNTAVAEIEDWSQQAAGFLAASNNTEITSSTDSWAARNGTSIADYTSVTFDATFDVLVMEFYTENGGYSGVGFEGYLFDQYKTADEVYGASTYYGG
jgi:hypothetical protein